MPIQIVTGDPTLTQAQTLAIGNNRKGKTELGKLEARLADRYPAAFATYRRQARAERIHAGEYWIWRESKPYLAFFVVRDSAVGATRLRYVQNIAIAITRDYRYQGIQSLAIAPLSPPNEWGEIKKVLLRWFERSKLQVVLYDTYLPGDQAEEDLPD